MRAKQIKNLAQLTPGVGNSIQSIKISSIVSIRQSIISVNSNRVHPPGHLSGICLFSKKHVANRPFALRGHVTSLLLNENFDILPSKND